MGMLHLKWAWFIWENLLLVLDVFTWLFGYFLAAAVLAGSWFSWLQALGMGVPLKWAWFTWKTLQFILDVFTWLFDYFWGAAVPTGVDFLGSGQPGCVCL
ncbi:hypothetical protein L210DRAFT_2201031 [Boletus edulis BED1]|uniref:Uncharacterized protein n=1 Tax=Boletus edulis BED1 TaxID=1328754 RepID=A0AAD4G7R8_BOLED|nr:hypothetical protein L210DRAFT_2201031 [Boletus edulis BED1]